MWQDLGHKFGSSRGAALVLVLVPLTSSWLVGLGRVLELEGGLHPQAPMGALGLPVHPAGPWGELVSLGRASPVCSSSPGLWRGTVWF